MSLGSGAAENVGKEVTLPVEGGSPCVRSGPRLASCADWLMPASNVERARSIGPRLGQEGLSGLRAEHEAPDVGTSRRCRKRTSISDADGDPNGRCPWGRRAGPSSGRGPLVGRPCVERAASGPVRTELKVDLSAAQASRSSRRPARSCTNAWLTRQSTAWTPLRPGTARSRRRWEHVVLGPCPSGGRSGGLLERVYSASEWLACARSPGAGRRPFA